LRGFSSPASSAHPRICMEAVPCQSPRDTDSAARIALIPINRKKRLGMREPASWRGFRSSIFAFDSEAGERPVWAAVIPVAAATTSRLEEGDAHIAQAGDLAIWWFRVRGAMKPQGAASVSETQALMRARSTVELATLPESRISLTRQCLPCLSSPLTASSVNGATRVDCLAGWIDAFSVSVAISSSHWSPLENSETGSSCVVAAARLFCSICLARAFVSCESPCVVVPAMGF
jgi:hypothetical protein